MCFFIVSQRVIVWKSKKGCLEVKGGYLEVKVVKGSYGRLCLPEVKGQYHSGKGK